MALPPELRDELKKISGLPLAPELGAAMEGHANLAAAKAQGHDASNLFNSAMIATDDLHEAETLARAYAKSLSLQGLVEEPKVLALDWHTIFGDTTAADLYTAPAASIDEALKEAEGGVLIIAEPYRCPDNMSPRDFAQSNYSAVSHLLEKMDEVEDSFERAFDALFRAGNSVNEIEKQMSGQSFENPRKPVVIIIGRRDDMESMVAEDPYPWNLRFAHKFGVSYDATTGVKNDPAPKAPSPKDPAPKNSPPKPGKP